MVGSTLVWHFSNFAFNAIAARMLGPASYGSLAAVVALLYVASPLFVSIQTVTSRLTTKLGNRGEWARVRGLARFYGLRLALAGLLLVAAFALSSSALARFLRVPSQLPIAILGIGFLFSTITHLQRGVLQGSMRFGRYAVSAIAEAGMKIVATVVLLIWIWPSVEGAILAIALASLFAAIVNGGLLRFLPKPRGRVDPIAHPFRYSLVTLCCLLLLATLLSVDLLAAKRYLDPHDAGLYAAVSLAGKIAFFATSALALYLFPIFSERQEQGIDSRRPLKGALAVLVAGSAVLTTIYFLAPQIVIGPLFGSRYAPAGDYIGWMGIAFSAYAVVYLLAMYMLAREDPRVNSVLALSVLAQLAGLYARHSSIAQIVSVQLAVLVSTALVLGTVALRARTVASTAQARAAHDSAAPEPT